MMAYLHTLKGLGTCQQKIYSYLFYRQLFIHFKVAITLGKLQKKCLDKNNHALKTDRLINEKENEISTS